MEKIGSIDRQIEGQTIRPRSAFSYGISYHMLGIISACAEFALIVISYLLVDYLYEYTLYGDEAAFGRAASVATLSAVFFILLAKALNLYTLTSLLNPSKIISKLCIGCAGSALLVLATFFALRAGTAFSRGSIGIFFVVSLLALVFMRLLAARALQRLIAQGVILGRRAVIIGEPFELTKLTPSSLLIDFGIRELTRISIGGGATFANLSDEDLKKLDYAIAVAREQRAEELAIALSWSQADLIKAIETHLRITPLSVRLLSDRALRAMIERQSLSTLGSTPSVDLQRAPLDRAERFAKRTCDIALALIALVALSPLLLLTSLAIKLDSAGSIIFRQRRVGFDGREFFINKFRTMVVMEDGPQIVQTRRNDPRVTRVGHLLRQSSIDELPQLLNVLKGEMSLVGPRPHAVAHDHLYGPAISNYAFRHHVKPGITGWAQVNGLRGETKRVEDMERRVAFDLWYINNWSLLLDARILLRTCLEVTRRGAY